MNEPNPPFPYPGGKRRIAKRISFLLPPHECYVEPFGGAAAILLSKAESRVEVYNDINNNLSTFFEVARDNPEALMDWLGKTPYSRQLHERYSNRLYGDGETPTDVVEIAGMFFYIQTASFGGKIDDQFKPPQIDSGRWRNFGKEYRNKIRNIQALSDRISDVTIECDDWNSIVDRYDSSTTCFYFDPPYVGTESYYSVDFDHDAFVDALCDIEGKFVLSYGDVLPDDMNHNVVSETDIHRSIGNENSHGDNMKERLITNFDPDSTDTFSGSLQSGVDQFS